MKPHAFGGHKRISHGSNGKRKRNKNHYHQPCSVPRIVMLSLLILVAVILYINATFILAADDKDYQQPRDGSQQTKEHDRLRTNNQHQSSPSAPDVPPQLSSTTQQGQTNLLDQPAMDKGKRGRRRKDGGDENLIPLSSSSFHNTNAASASRHYTASIFQEAGVALGEKDWERLPTWEEIMERIGEPVVYGLETCARFREMIPPVMRNIGCCGMFNSGTNLVTRLLKENCKIPERVEFYGMKPDFNKWGMGPGDAHGMRWQVPWGKHTAARYREQHSTEKASNITKETVLPVVTVRHPYFWFQSMCKNSYTAKWNRGRKHECPRLVDGRNQPFPLTVRYGAYEDKFDSLADLYNGWYRQYWKDATYPRLMVRFEDLIFHAHNVTEQICHCAGGIIRTDRPFFHIVNSAKEGPGHGKKEERTGMVEAWVRYGRAMEVQGGFSERDFEASKRLLDSDFMKLFHYQHPPAS